LANAQENVQGRVSDFCHPLFANLQMLGDLLGLNDVDGYRKVRKYGGKRFSKGKY
jgi:hypothetical protein